MTLSNTYARVSQETLQTISREEAAKAMAANIQQHENAATINALKPLTDALDKLRALSVRRNGDGREITPGIDYHLGEFRNRPILIIKYGYETPFEPRYQGQGREIRVGWYGHDAKKFFLGTYLVAEVVLGRCVTITGHDESFDVTTFGKSTGYGYEPHYTVSQDVSQLGLRETVEHFIEWLAKEAPGNEEKFAPILEALDRAMQPSPTHNDPVRTASLFDWAHGAAKRLLHQNL